MVMRMLDEAAKDRWFREQDVAATIAKPKFQRALDESQGRMRADDAFRM